MASVNRYLSEPTISQNVNILASVVKQFSQKELHNRDDFIRQIILSLRDFNPSTKLDYVGKMLLFQSTDRIF